VRCSASSGCCYTDSRLVVAMFAIIVVVMILVVSVFRSNVP